VIGHSGTAALNSAVGLSATFYLYDPVVEASNAVPFTIATFSVLEQISETVNVNFFEVISL